MYTSGAEPGRGGERSEGAAIVAMAVLIILVVLWPAPVLWLNEATLQTSLDIDEEAFFGREALQWDVVFWWIVGLTGIVIGRTDLATVRSSIRIARGSAATFPRRARDGVRSLGRRTVFTWAAATLLLVSLAVFAADPLVTGWLSRTDQSRVVKLTSLANRLGSGAVPSLITVFIGIVGVSRARPLWIRLFMAIVGASLVSGMALQIVKIIAGRARPELWFGHCSFLIGGDSLPSGHTLSTFIVAGSVAMAARSNKVRIAVLGLAVLLAAARVMTFRHWVSDVAVSAALGLGTIWFFWRVLVVAVDDQEGETSRGPIRS